MPDEGRDRLEQALRKSIRDTRRLQQLNRELTAARSEPIAIVAMSCRFPGADDPEALWELLARGADLIGDFPSDRGWDASALHDPDPDARGKITVCQGAFLRTAAEFDAAFFGISPREALSIDPQQRILLETCWEAVERAGIDPRTLQGSPTGVFMGLWQSHYGLLPLPPELEGFIGLGNVPSIASGRIAYSLGLRGPALTLDTACSSSLVAVHLACQSLRQGECNFALAGGVTVMATPFTFIEFSRQRGLAADGRCKPYSAAADGTAWGEGAGIVALERLSDAQRNGHPILALVRGSAVNQDGKSQGLKAPNGPAQEQLIRQALANARLAASDIDAVEGHGTGTVLGDPIEAQALLATYGAEHTPDRPLWLGSLKSNLGHTQAAAGIAGILKMVLAMQHGQLPKSLHADPPSPHVDWSAGTVRLLAEPVAWPDNGQARRAGVSSFAMSGTNAHVILEQAPAAVPEATEAATACPSPLAFVISARSEAALRAQAERLRACLADPKLALPDLALSLAATRSAFERRAVVVVEDRPALLATLAQLAAGEPAPDAVTARAAHGVGLALLFTGQGSQRPQMGLALYRSWPAFRNALDELFAGFEGELAPALPDVMFADAGSALARRLDTTAYAQPALFALEVALYRWLEGCGVRARYLIGHSVGELAAAHVAGVMSLADACKLVAARGRLMQALPEGGAMVAIEASEAELAPLLAAARGVDLAAVNGERALVISGDEAAALELAAAFERRGRRTRRLTVSHAFHSERMQPMLDAYAQVLRGIALHPARLGIVSNVRGELAEPELFSTPEYWLQQVRAAVRFHPGVCALQAKGATGYLELGPHAVLSALVQAAQANAAERAPVWAALRNDRSETEAVLRALGGLHATGHALDWTALYAGIGAKRVRLPTYAFQRERFWPDAPGDSLVAPRQAAARPNGQPATATSPAAAGPSLHERLAGHSASEQTQIVLKEVGAAFALVTSAKASADLDPDQPLLELGLDSLMAVELRNQLAARTGLRLGDTLAFDYPTVRKLARHLQEQLTGGARAEPALPATVDASEPIAIVGMACRYPGGVDSPDALWQLLVRGGDATTDFPRDRGWNLGELFDADPDRPGRSTVSRGGFLHDVADFDAGFFGISPREALATDPQQRLLLETSWEALERTGIDPRSLEGSSTGVFMGIAQGGYAELALQRWTELEGHLTTGNANSVASGRIAYTLGLQGPAISLDTACSSSLVAVHLAAQALRHGECDLALAGGVTVLATPYTFIAFSRQRALAPDGRCKPFSDAADGTAWAEGAGVLVLERLSDARRHGHPVLALLRGSAINQDGRSQGLTAPSGPAQRQVIRRALASARLSAADIDVLEAHGTGTRLGDPIEAAAVRATYGADRPQDRPLWLGSLKSNLGHAQAAAGVGGVIKMVLALEHEHLPESLHADRPSRHIDWSDGTLQLLRAPRAWPRTGDRARRAGVSSFGMSGTNAHVILEEAPPSPVPDAAVIAADRPLPFALSARSPAALRAQAERLRQHLIARPELALSDLAHSLVATRSAFEHRAVIVATSRAQLLEDLAALVQEQPRPQVSLGRARARAAAVTFVFGDRQSSWPAGVGELARSCEAFAAELRACEAAFEVPLLACFADGAAVRQCDATLDAAHFALAVSLAAWWRSLGIEPAALVGLGAGETPAAYVAGVLTLEEAWQLVKAGKRPTIARLSAARVPVHASPPFTELSAQLIASGQRSFAVLGAHPTLERTLRELADRTDAQVVVAAAARAERVDLETSLSALATLYAAGVPVDLRRAIADGARVALPTYAFQRTRYWPDVEHALPTPAAAPAQVPAPAARQPLERVLHELAAVMRVARPGLDPDADLHEMGLDSLLALDLRGRLAAAFGDLELAPTLFYEHRTARALATELDRRVTEPAAKSGGRALLALVRQSVQDGASRDFAWQLLDLAARVRREAEPKLELEPLACRLVPLGRTPAAAQGARLVCLPSLVPPTGPAQYMRLATALEAQLEVSFLSTPGWTEAERLPRDRHELVASLAAALRQQLGDRTFALCGFSSGGWIAHALTAQLERAGAAPAALVLLDTHFLASNDVRTASPNGPSLLRALVRLPGETPRPEPAQDAELTAMVEYMRLFEDFQPTPLATPTLLVSCARVQLGAFALPGAPRFDARHALLHVDADHFSMLLEDAAQTAGMLARWLRGRLSPERPRAALPGAQGLERSDL